MKDRIGKIEFEASRANLELALREFWKEGKIDEPTYLVFLRRTLRAKRTGELARLARELAELVKKGQGENGARG